MLSIAVTIGLCGAIYGGKPVSYMCMTLGYHYVIGIFILLGIILSIITYATIPMAATTQQRSVIADIYAVFSNTPVMLTCFCAGLMVGPLEGFADVWGTEFLRKVYQFDTTFATTAPSMIFLGMCFGAPLLSLAAEKSGNYLGTIVAAGLCMTLSFGALIAGYATQTSIYLSFILVGICCAYQILAIYKASIYVNARIAGLATAVANMIIMLFGYLFHSIIGTVINYRGGIESPNAFIYGIAVIPGALMLGTVGFLLLAMYEKNYRKEPR
jgi:hypothetical protein